MNDDYISSILNDLKEEWSNNSCYLQEEYLDNTEYLSEGEYYHGEITNIKCEAGNSPCVLIIASINNNGKELIVSQRFFLDGVNRAHYYNKLLVLLGGIKNYLEAIKQIDFTSSSSFVSTSKFLIGAPVKYFWKSWDNSPEEKYLFEKVKIIMILEGIYDSKEHKVIKRR